MNDPQAAQRVVDTVKRVALDACVLMRTRYLEERDGLLKLGARDVVAEEVEGAIEMIAGCSGESMSLATVSVTV